MEYLREEAVEKEEDIEKVTCRVGTIAYGESSDKTKTSNEDVEMSHTIEGWSEKERKVSWVDRIKTIGKIQNWIVFDQHLTPTYISEKKVLPCTVEHRSKYIIFPSTKLHVNYL